MLFVLTGPDSYRREESAEAILEAYTGKHGQSALQVFNMSEEGAVARFFEFVRTRGLFDPFSLAILKNISELKKAGELKKILKNLTESKTVMVLISEPSLGREFAFLK